MGTRESALLADIAAYVEALQITQGRRAGEEFELLTWQREFLADALADADAETAALTCARGNGKSTFIGAICAAAVDGPLAESRADTLLVASSRGQAKLTFEHTLAFLGPKINAARVEWRVRESMHDTDITYRPTNTRIRVLGSDPRRLHGPAPKLIIAEEPAQWPPTTAARMFAALETSLGKIPGARMIAVGTKSADPDSWFSRWCDGEADVAHVYSSAAGSPLNDATYRRANPSFDHLPDLARTIRKAAAKAAREPTLRPQFDALRLNSGTLEIARSELLDQQTWAALERERDDLPDAAGEYVLGLDLSSGYAMSAAAACWPSTGRADILAAFPAIPDLAKRGADARVGDAYDRMARDGDLIICGERTVDLVEFLTLAMARFGGPPGQIACDRWRRAELLDALAALGLPMVNPIWRGQGWKDGGQDVSDFRAAAANRAIAVPRSYALRHAVSKTVTIGDPAGNWKIAKRKSAGFGESSGRDDLAVALVLAAAEAARIARRGPPRFDYAGGVIT